MQFTEKTNEMFLHGKIGAVGRTWFLPFGEPTQNISIVVNSNGVAMPALGVIRWDVIYGGYWSAGTPYEETATHVGGRIVASNVLFAGLEAAYVIHNDTTFFASNRRLSKPGINRKGFGGYPVVLQVTNGTLDDIRLYITFISRSVSIP